MSLYASGGLRKKYKRNLSNFYAQCVFLATSEHVTKTGSENGISI
jgi:hypothetical protein